MKIIVTLTVETEDSHDAKWWADAAAEALKEYGADVTYAFHEVESERSSDNPGGLRPPPETPVFDRILAHYKDNLDGILTELNPNANFILVERNNGMSGGVFLTTHDSLQAAANYWTTQEDYWEIEKLVDLRTGEEYLGNLQIEWKKI